MSDMPNDQITQRLAEMLSAQGQDPHAMLDSEDRQAEGLPARRSAAQEIDARIADGRLEAVGGQSPTREQAADQPWLYTGRGPTGRLRNFRAMNGGKLEATLFAIGGEANDLEALTACSAEYGSRS